MLRHFRNGALCALFSIFTPIYAQQPLDPPLKNWAAPLYWSPELAQRNLLNGTVTARTQSASPFSSPGAMTFFAMTPCRVMDTRTGRGFPSPFGPPSISPGVARDVPMLSSPCNSGIPSTVGAYSVNVAVVPPGPLAYLTLWPEGLPFPGTATLNDLSGGIVDNAAIVPAGTNGDIQVYATNSTDVIIDINGYYASPTDANSNTGIGEGALLSNSTGASNTALGQAALFSNTTGTNNTAIGTSALTNNVSGSNNIGIGQGAAGLVANGNSGNIEIGTRGASADSGTIRIGGSSTFSDPAVQTAFFVAGVASTAVSGVSVLIDTSTGQLGVASSSRRYKEDIHDMGDASRGLMQLRPVTFRYKKPFADGAKPVQYGLIAEEVAKVYPDLVARSADGQIETVKYQVLPVMLLNEVQRQQAQSDAQATRIQTLERQLQEQRQQLDEQRQQNQMLLERLSKLESAIASLDHSR